MPRRRRLPELNATVRGFLIIALVALTVVVLQLYQTLAALFIIARIAFFLAIAFFLYLLWRERREEIGAWPTRARAVFFAAVVILVADLGAISIQRPAGLQAVAFVLVLAICGYSLYRVWRHQRTWGY